METPDHAAGRPTTPPGGNPAPPLSPADIPGLGIIRLRALRKAGLETIEDLKSATIEQLTAVPGLTEVKARYIHDYLSGAAPAAGSEGESAPPDAAEAAGEAPAIPPLSALAARGLGQVVSILLAPEAPDFRSRLLRELSRFAVLAEELVSSAPRLGPKEARRAERLLHRCGEEILQLTGRGASDRKAQARLAERLAEANDRLTEAVTAPAAPEMAR